MKNDIMLSVIVISYNQENYIRDAIESVINQETKYKYEILLADDYSPDNTNKILEEYREKYPELIKIVPRTKNLGGPANSYDACSRSKGKYICVLEGDDYWCNNNRIETMVSFLEDNPDYSAVSHLQKGINSNGKIIGIFPKWVNKDREITVKDFLDEKHFSLTGSVTVNYYLNEELRKKLKIISSFSRNVGDYQKCIFILDIGRVYIMNTAMMVYRYRNDSNNYNSRYSIDEICIEHLHITNKLDDFYKNKYNFFQKYLRHFTIGFFYSILKGKFSSIKKLNGEIVQGKRVLVYLCMPYMIVRIVLERIFKSKGE